MAERQMPDIYLLFNGPDLSRYPIISAMNADLLPDDRLANFATGPHYQLLDVIGEGAYGIVVYDQCDKY